MCGIVGAIAKREIPEILLEGLRRLEYRGYDSAGLAVIDSQQQLQLHKALGKVVELENLQKQEPRKGKIGIAHTRWATHGEPSQANAHPHASSDQIALVHNGIIENHQALRTQLESEGYSFSSDTDSEVVVHRLHQLLQESDDLRSAMQKLAAELDGAFALAAVNREQPDVIVGARRGSPLVIGVGIGENFLASDPLALRQVTDRFIYLEEGDVVEISTASITIWSSDGSEVKRPVERLTTAQGSIDRGEYSHYMLKEIYEQPKALANTLAGKHNRQRVLDAGFGHNATAVFDQVKNIQIVACGTSYHSGLVARYWLEEHANIPLPGRSGQ